MSGVELVGSGSDARFVPVDYRKPPKGLAPEQWERIRAEVAGYPDLRPEQANVIALLAPKADDAAA